MRRFRPMTGVLPGWKTIADPIQRKRRQGNSCSHKLEEFLEEYLKVSKLREKPDTPLSQRRVIAMAIIETTPKHAKPESGMTPRLDTASAANKTSQMDSKPAIGGVMRGKCRRNMGTSHAAAIAKRFY
jgi:hypothetical protein